MYPALAADAAARRDVTAAMVATISLRMSYLHFGVSGLDKSKLTIRPYATYDCFDQLNMTRFTKVRVASKLMRRSMDVLDFERIEAISEPMRELIEDLWPELVNKLPPKAN